MLCLGKLQQQFVSHEKKESGTAQDLQYEMREMGRELGKEATADALTCTRQTFPRSSGSLPIQYMRIHIAVIPVI